MRAPSEVVHEHLALYLGPYTAKNALKTFSAKALGKAPEAVTLNEAPQLLQALRPMMRTLLGVQQCEHVLRQVTKELGL